MSVSVTGAGYRDPVFETKLPKKAHDDARKRIAQALRSDINFMAELKRFGLYDEDAKSVIDDELELVVEA